MRRTRWVAGLATLAAVVSGVIATPARAAALTPPLDVPVAQLDAAITCSQSPASAGRDIILMIPPTLFDPGEAYAWNYQLAFHALGWPYCSVTMPDHTDGDIQVNAEYIVNAVRLLHQQSRRQVELFGWSQGASTAPRWALRWWPDIRPLVASLVGLAPVDEGGANTVEGYCIVACIPAAWQQVKRIDSEPPHFMTALNSRPQTFPVIAYTDIYSLTDEVAGLNVITPPVSPLPPAPNVLDVSTQQICPLQVVEHLDIPATSAAYAVAIAALRQPGALPNLAAINPATVCPDPFMPYVTPLSFVAHEAEFASVLPGRLTTGLVTSEPPLRCYVTDNCT